MTYKRAKLIQNLILEMKKDCECLDYLAEIIPNPAEKGDFRLAIMSRTESDSQLMDLLVFAKALAGLGTSLFIRSGVYFPEPSMVEKVSCYFLD